MTNRGYQRRNSLRYLSIVFHFLLCVFVLALLVPTNANSRETIGSAGSLKGDLIDIGGARHLNLVCAGKGSPTVVFLQGLGGGITAWRKVREPVSSITRTCFYDRAGFGYSEPSNQPSTANNVTNDLHALLYAAGITDRVVLVGHSLGGLFATLYTDKYEKEVAGLVLIDPSLSNQFDYVPPKAMNLMRADEIQFLETLKACQSLAKKGQLSGDENHNCFHLPPNLTPDVVEYLSHQGTNPFYYASGISEIENFFPVKQWVSIDGSEEMKSHRSFGNKPLVVLTAGVASHDSRMSDADNAKLAEYWKLGHEALAARSTRGKSIIVPQSRHDIQADRPEAVIEAIRKVIFQVRQSDVR